MTNGSRDTLNSLISTPFCIVALFLAFSAAGQSGTAFSAQKVTPPAGNHQDMFGFSVATDGNYVLVGSIRQDHPKNGADTGAAVLYQLKKNQWHFEAMLSPVDVNTKDGFGGKLAIHGSTAAIGAIGYDDQAEDVGSVFIFQPDANGKWQETARITAPDANAGDAFGQSIALFENRLIVGAPKDDDQGKDSGSVYVFERIGSKWTFIQKLTAQDTGAGDVFGISVALSGDTILIGADLNDEKANNAGAAYVYTQSQNKWKLQAKLMANDAGDTDIFGVRVALDGDTALISARRDDDEKAGKDAGSAYVFKRTGDKWQQEAKLVGPNAKADDRFGRDVAIVGDTLLIGAMHRDDKGENAGGAYVYKRKDDAWVLSETLYAGDGASDDLFGWSVALSESYAVVGATGNSFNGVKTGAAYIFCSH